MPLIVLTGVNGFIANNLCEMILSASPEELGFPCKKTPKYSEFEETNTSNTISVLGTDLSESLSRDTARRFTGSARYQYCDYESLFETLAHLSKPPDIVVHNGACSSTTETDKSVFDKLNLEYSKKIWEYCTQNNVPLIYASSAAVYGDGKEGFSDRKENCDDYTALNLYGQSKLDFDLWALEQKNTPSTWFGLRYFNVFGPHEGHKKGQASMVYHGFHQATKNAVIKLFKSNSDKFENGEQVRDFIYIDNIVQITKSLIKVAIQRKNDLCAVKLPGNGLFLNVGSGIANTWNSLAVAVFEALELKPNIEYIDMPEQLTKQYQNYTCADLSLLMSVLPDLNCSVFQDSVKKYVQSYLLRGLD